MFRVSAFNYDVIAGIMVPSLCLPSLRPVEWLVLGPKREGCYAAMHKSLGLSRAAAELLLVAEQRMISAGLLAQCQQGASGDPSRAIMEECV